MKNYEYQAVLEAKKYAQNGILVDIGCGRQPYKKDLLPYVKKYIGVDHPQVSKKYKNGEKPDILADATSIPLPKNYSHVTMMISVLEHLPNPSAAVKEAFRITKNKGVFIAITIQNYRLHDEPYDFFRYTKYGLKQVVSESGFKTIKTISLGNYPILASQYFNTYILYKVRELLKSNMLYKLLGLCFLPPILLLCLISNIIAAFFYKSSTNKGSGPYAIYNLIIAKKLVRR